MLKFHVRVPFQTLSSSFHIYSTSQTFQKASHSHCPYFSISSVSLRRIRKYGDTFCIAVTLITPRQTFNPRSWNLINSSNTVVNYTAYVLSDAASKFIIYRIEESFPGVLERIKILSAAEHIRSAPHARRALAWLIMQTYIRRGRETERRFANFRGIILFRFTQRWIRFYFIDLNLAFFQVDLSLV